MVHTQEKFTLSTCCEPTSISRRDPTQQPTFAPMTAEPTINTTSYLSSIPTKISLSNPTFIPTGPTMISSNVLSSEPTFNPSILPSFVENYNVLNFTTIIPFSIDNCQIEYRL